MRVFKKLRGLFGTAATWAAGWSVLGLGHGLAQGLVLETTLFYAVAGAIAGSGYSGMLGWWERRSTLKNLKRSRVALWGALGGALVPAVVHATTLFVWPGGWPDVALIAVLTGVLGAGSSFGTLWLARREQPTVEGTPDREMVSGPETSWGDGVARVTREPQHVPR